MSARQPEAVGSWPVATVRELPVSVVPVLGLDWAAAALGAAAAVSAAGLQVVLELVPVTIVAPVADSAADSLEVPEVLEVRDLVGSARRWPSPVHAPGWCRSRLHHVPHPGPRPSPALLQLLDQTLIGVRYRLFAQPGLPACPPEHRPRD